MSTDSGSLRAADAAGLVVVALTPVELPDPNATSVNLGGPLLTTSSVCQGAVIERTTITDDASDAWAAPIRTPVTGKSRTDVMLGR